MSNVHDVEAASAYRTARRTLPVLDSLRVASPCEVSWDAMVGNGRVRHCAKCSKEVFNISNMSRSDAELFLLDRAGAGGACVTFYRRSDGTILTPDCPVGVRIRRRADAVVAVVTAAFLGALAVVGLGGKVGTPVASAETGFSSCDLPRHAAGGSR
jgi:hypothetical protein